MIHGIGIDLVSTERFQRFVRDHSGSLSDLFTPFELATPESLPEAFAIKEATLKALGGLSGWELDWREIGLASAGALELTGRVRSHASALRVRSIRGSVTRTGAQVFATAIAERD